MANTITCVVNDTVIGNTGLRSEHGLAFWVETDHGVVLFDTGQTAAGLSYNMGLLGLKPQNINALALSHSHYDHTGGLPAVLSKNTNLSIYAHSDIFEPRYSFRNGEYHSIGLQWTRETLINFAHFELSDSIQPIFPNLWTTGEITDRPEPEGRSATHFIHTEKSWQPNLYRDDISLVLKTKKGLALICGCCHAGLLNTLLHIRRHFTESITVVLGGTHLISADASHLSHLMDVIGLQFPNLHFYLNHCTGEQACKTLKIAFGSRVKTCPAGTIIKLGN